jgi:hypothetical protein
MRMHKRLTARNVPADTICFAVRELLQEHLKRLRLQQQHWQQSSSWSSKSSSTSSSSSSS